MSRPSRDVDETPTRSLGGSEPSPSDGPWGELRRPKDGPSRYAVIEEVGRGGMGRVLRAYDPKLQREVALKEVKGDALDEDAAQRLVAEARAMAKLSHPNVVAVYDVEERPSYGVVLVMEYVAGRTLRRWLADERRAWSEVVGCFIEAGKGLEAAHDAGLLHRDFKPSNVMVSEEVAERGNRRSVKVTDFGLAKVNAVDACSEESSWGGVTSSEELTQDGTILGTPRYMAPEQHRGEPLTAAADQYAFCVALWGALCGGPPFSGQIVQMREAKQEGPPRWPNARVPRRVAEAVVRGLHPESQHRWPSMGQLLAALDHDPSRRRARWLRGGAGVLVVGALGWGASMWQEARLQRCSGARARLGGVWDESRSAEVGAAFAAVDEAFAADAWSKTRRELDEYAEGWAQMHTEACEATAVRGEQSARVLDLRMACLHRAVVELGATVDTLADADPKVVQEAHRLTAGLRPLERCADVHRLSADVEPPLPREAETVDGIRAHLARASGLRTAARLEEAEAEWKDARRLAEGLEYEAVRTEVLLEKGWRLSNLGRYAESKEALEEALRQGAKLGQWELVGHAGLSLVYTVGSRMHLPEEGLRYWPLVDGLSDGDPRFRARALHNHASVLSVQGKDSEAEAEYREALRIKIETLGPEHLDVALSRNNLAQTLFERRRFAEAEIEIRAALSTRSMVMGLGHPDVAQSRTILASILVEQGQAEAAEEEFRKALEVRLDVLGPDHPDVAAVWSNLSNALIVQGRHAEAEAVLRRALPVFERALGEDDPSAAITRYNLADVSRIQGKLAEAEVELGAALLQMERALGPEHPLAVRFRCSLADLLLERDKPNDALPVAEQCWAEWQGEEVPVEMRARAAQWLARALWDADEPAQDRGRARELGLDALRLLRLAEDSSDEDVAEVQRWLDEHPLP